MNRKHGPRLSLATLKDKVLGLVPKQLRLPKLRSGNRRRGWLRKATVTAPMGAPAKDQLSHSTSPLGNNTPFSSGLTGGSAEKTGGRLSHSRLILARGLRGRLRHLGTLIAWAAPFALAMLAFALPVIGVRAYDYVMASGYFHVRQVLVDGASHVSREQVLAIAGIVPGTHLLEADLDVMRQKLEADPWIHRARVESVLPDTLVVHLAEHQPTAFLAASELYLVDETGTPFMVAPVDEDLHLPVLTGIDPSGFDDTKQAGRIRQRVSGALNVLRMWEAQGLNARYPIGEVRIDGPRGYVVVVESQANASAGAPRAIEIVLGRGPFTDKLYRLEWILEHLHAQGKTPAYVLLDQLDGVAPENAEALGGARVVVKTDVDIEDAAELAPLAVPEPAEPAPAAGSPARPGPRPARPAPQAEPAPAAPIELGEPPHEEPVTGDGDEPVEAAPLSGGRPAAIPDLEE